MTNLKTGKNESNFFGTSFILNTGEKYKVSRVEDSKYNYLLFEVYPRLKQSFIKIREIKFASITNFEKKGTFDS